jgi:hypothetical protein
MGGPPQPRAWTTEQNVEDYRLSLMALGMLSQGGMKRLLTIAFLAGLLAPPNPAAPPRPNPRWKVKVLIYTKVDFAFTDFSSRSHHVVTAMTDAEQARAVFSSKRFFESDVPALNGGAMKPVLSIEVKTQPLTRLTNVCGDTGFSPFPGDLGSDFSNQYDSFVVIWKGDGWDSETNSATALNCYGGLTFYMGTDPTVTAIASVMVELNHRNVFKHEWGHSILFYYDAAGTAPKPTVDNHIGPGMYVHCGSGAPYILMDEDDAVSIPNSIYNNQSGFHRDYYSGQTALASQPDVCLGITPQAWASGGPRTKPIPFPGDLNRDQLVNRADLEILSRSIGLSPDGPNDPRDLDYDGVVTVSDARLLVLLCSKPSCTI